MEPISVLDAADEHGRFAVEVLAGLDARIERAPLSEAALRRADVAVVGRAAHDWIARRREWPRLVMVAVTPFGLAGPCAAWAGDELTAQAAGGMVWPNGQSDSPPLRLPGDQATRCAGLHAALGALLALLARRRDGRGRLVDVSLQESATAALEHVAGEWFDHRRPSMRQGTLHWSGTFRVGRCRDGAALLSHVGDWTALREWLIADGAAQDLVEARWDDVDERCRHAGHVFDVLDAWAARYAVGDLVAQAQLRRLPFAPVWDFAKFASELETIPGAEILSDDGVRGRGHGALCGKSELAGAAPSAPVVWSAHAPIQRAPTERRPPSPPWNRRTEPPLHGVRVIDFTWVVAGPLATRVLADFGAEVVRVERPDAPIATGHSEANLRRGKRSVTLDLRTATGIAAARELLRDADVVVDNFSRRVLPNFGLDDDALRALNPRLVVVHLPGFPAADERADWVSFGPTIQAMAGLVAEMRTADGSPVGPGFAYADTTTGWAAALAIVAALWRGEGVRIALSQRDVMALMLGPLLAAARDGAPPSVTTSGIYRCADVGGMERWCAIAAPLEVRQIAWARERVAEDVVAHWQAAGIAAAVVATPADLATEPQLLARGWWQSADGMIRDGVVPRLVE